jgi:hypothetical protein
MAALIAYSGISQQVDAQLRMLSFRAEIILELLGNVNITLFSIIAKHLYYILLCPKFTIRSFGIIVEYLNSKAVACVFFCLLLNLWYGV